jgi:hypothetical protein
MHLAAKAALGAPQTREDARCVLGQGMRVHRIAVGRNRRIG